MSSLTTNRYLNRVTIVIILTGILVKCNLFECNWITKHNRSIQKKYHCSFNNNAKEDSSLKSTFQLSTRRSSTYPFSVKPNTQKSLQTDENKSNITRVEHHWGSAYLIQDVSGS